MNNILELKRALNISAAILLKKGEISTEDIRSLPFLKKDVDIYVIVKSLLKLFDAELTCNRVSSKPFLIWEETIRLKSRQPQQQI